MSESEPTPSTLESSPPPKTYDFPPRTDLLASVGWAVLGLAILIGSVTMDRLEDQDINPYTIPGLLPGLLGIAIMILAAILAVRSIRRGGLKPRSPGEEQILSTLFNRHLLLVLVICLGFGVGLVGHGLPFWLAAAVFVTCAIIFLQHAQRKAAGQKLTLRAAVTAAVIGFAAGGIITVLFQEVFLVRLP